MLLAFILLGDVRSQCPIDLQNAETRVSREVGQPILCQLTAKNIVYSLRHLYHAVRAACSHCGIAHIYDIPNISSAYSEFCEMHTRSVQGADLAAPLKLLKNLLSQDALIADSPQKAVMKLLPLPVQLHALMACTDIHSDFASESDHSMPTIPASKVAPQASKILTYHKSLNPGPFSFQPGTQAINSPPVIVKYAP